MPHPQVPRITSVITEAWKERVASQRAARASQLVHIDNMLAGQQKSVIAEGKGDLLRVFNGTHNARRTTLVPTTRTAQRNFIATSRSRDNDYGQRHELRHVYLVEAMKVRMELRTAAAEAGMRCNFAEPIDVVCRQILWDKQDVVMKWVESFREPAEIPQSKWSSALITDVPATPGDFLKSLDEEFPPASAKADLAPGRDSRLVPGDALPGELVDDLLLSAGSVAVIRNETREQLKTAAVIETVTRMMDYSEIGQGVSSLDTAAALRFGVDATTTLRRAVARGTCESWTQAVQLMEFLDVVRTDPSPDLGLTG